MIEQLFVYGNLAPDRPNEHVLGEIGGTWEAGTVTGRLGQRKEQNMSNYHRITRECTVSQLHPELRQAIQSYFQAHDLGNPETESLMCCETTQMMILVRQDTK